MSHDERAQFIREIAARVDREFTRTTPSSVEWNNRVGPREVHDFLERLADAEDHAVRSAAPAGSR